MADAELGFFEAPITSIGPIRPRALLLKSAVGASAYAKISAAASAASDCVLTPAEADAAIAMLAMRATALRFGGGVPLVRLVPDAKELSALDGTAAMLIDPHGPMMGPRHDAESHAATLALGGAIRLARASTVWIVGVPPGAEDPPVVKPPVSEFAEVLGVAPVAVGAAVLGGVLLLGAAGALGWYVNEASGQRVKWNAKTTIAVRRAEVAADLALKRWNLEQQTGKTIAPSPLESGVAEDVKNLGADESRSRWWEFGIGAGVGVVGALGAGFAARRAGLV